MNLKSCEILTNPCKLRAPASENRRSCSQTGSVENVRCVPGSDPQWTVSLALGHNMSNIISPSVHCLNNILSMTLPPMTIPYKTSPQWHFPNGITQMDISPRKRLSTWCFPKAVVPNLYQGYIWLQNDLARLVFFTKSVFLSHSGNTSWESGIVTWINHV